jgi:alanine-glyoxylate transaminase/serine-glyoxylate transaminase/serine-pyruvate transaminase
MTDVMALAGLATAEMAMADIGIPIQLGSGVSVAQEYYRLSAAVAHSEPARAIA